MPVDSEAVVASCVPPRRIMRGRGARDVKEQNVLRDPDGRRCWWTCNGGHICKVWVARGHQRDAYVMAPESGVANATPRPMSKNRWLLYIPGFRTHPIAGDTAAEVKEAHMAGRQMPLRDRGSADAASRRSGAAIAAARRCGSEHGSGARRGLCNLRRGTTPIDRRRDRGGFVGACRRRLLRLCVLAENQLDGIAGKPTAWRRKRF